MTARPDLLPQVAAIVADVYRIHVSYLYEETRCRRHIANARMTAMYLSHLWLGLTYSQIGAHFGRDRTTVAHACWVVETWRDDGKTDDVLTTVETRIMAALSTNWEIAHAG